MTAEQEIKNTRQALKECVFTMRQMDGKLGQANRLLTEVVHNRDRGISYDLYKRLLEYLEA